MPFSCVLLILSAIAWVASLNVAAEKSMLPIRYLRRLFGMVGR